LGSATWSVALGNRKGEVGTSLKYRRKKNQNSARQHKKKKKTIYLHRNANPPWGMQGEGGAPVCGRLGRGENQTRLCNRKGSGQDSERKPQKGNKSTHTGKSTWELEQFFASRGGTINRGEKKKTAGGTSD